VAWWLLVDEWTYHALEKEREYEDENVAERREKRGCIGPTMLK
jgi:hypothetical protein